MDHFNLNLASEAVTLCFWTERHALLSRNQLKEFSEILQGNATLEARETCNCRYLEKYFLLAPKYGIFALVKTSHALFSKFTLIIYLSFTQ